MAWALRFDGSERVQLQNEIELNATGGGSYRIEVTLLNEDQSASATGFFCGSGSSPSRYLRQSNPPSSIAVRLLTATGSADNRTTGTDLDWQDDIIYTLGLESGNGETRAFRDDFSEQIRNQPRNFNLAFFGDGSTIRLFQGLMYEAKVFINGELAHHWINQTGTGNVWTDIVGGNHAELIGSWPTDDSQWVPYGEPSDDIDATIALTMPQFSAAVSAATTAPGVSASVAFTMPQFTALVDAERQVPQYAASATLTMPQFTAAITGDASAPVSGDCYAVRFNGVNNYGQFAERAIDPDGDIDIEVLVAANTTAGTSQGSVVSQNITSSGSGREFQFWLEFFANRININLGGINRAYLIPDWQPLEFNTFRLILTVTEGNSRRVQVFLNGESVVDTVAAFGASREPSALTHFGARNNGTASSYGHYLGAIIPFIRINGTYYPLSDRDQAVQPSFPAGNDLTLFNVAPEQWEQIPCDLRPSPAVVSYTMPQFAVAATAESAAPQYPASLAFAMPQFTAAVQAEAVAPSFEAAVSFVMPQFTAAATAETTVPEFPAVAAFTMPQFGVAASAEASLPTTGAVVSYTMPQFTVAASGASTVATLAANVAYTMPQFGVMVLTDETPLGTAPGARLSWVAGNNKLAYNVGSNRIQWRA